MLLQEFCFSLSYINHKSVAKKLNKYIEITNYTLTGGVFMGYSDHGMDSEVKQVAFKLRENLKLRIFGHWRIE